MRVRSLLILSILTVADAQLGEIASVITSLVGGSAPAALGALGGSGAALGGAAASGATGVLGNIGTRMF